MQLTEYLKLSKREKPKNTGPEIDSPGTLYIDEKETPWLMSPECEWEQVLSMEHEHPVERIFSLHSEMPIAAIPKRPKLTLNTLTSSGVYKRYQAVNMQQVTPNRYQMEIYLMEHTVSLCN